LGLCYIEGRGLPKNRGRARQWLAKAAASGYLPAQRQLDRIHADRRR
jgi:TPR repeat protein